MENKGLEDDIGLQNAVLQGTSVRSSDMHSLSQLWRLVPCESGEIRKFWVKIMIGNIGTTCQKLPLFLPPRNSLYLFVLEESVFKLEFFSRNWGASEMCYFIICEVNWQMSS